MDEQIINKRLQIINDLNEELSVLSEQYDDALENDPQYQEMQQKVEALKSEAKDEKDRVTQTVLDKSTFKRMREDIKEKKDELKTTREVLSQELVEYYKNTGKMEITDQDGNLKKMKFSVKLVS